MARSPIDLLSECPRPWAMNSLTCLKSVSPFGRSCVAVSVPKSRTASSSEFKVRPRQSDPTLRSHPQPPTPRSQPRNPNPLVRNPDGSTRAGHRNGTVQPAAASAVSRRGPPSFLGTSPRQEQNLLLRLWHFALSHCTALVSWAWGVGRRA